MNDLKRDANLSRTPAVSGTGNTAASSQTHAFDVLGFTRPTHGTNQRTSLGTNQHTSSSTSGPSTHTSGTAKTGHIGQVSSGNTLRLPNLMLDSEAS